MTFSSKHSKDNQDQGVARPSLKTPNGGPGQNREKINLEDFKSPRIFMVLFWGAFGFGKENSIAGRRLFC